MDVLWSFQGSPRIWGGRVMCIVEIFQEVRSISLILPEQPDRLMPIPDSKRAVSKSLVGFPTLYLNSTIQNAGCQPYKVPPTHKQSRFRYGSTLGGTECR